MAVRLISSRRSISSVAGHERGEAAAAAVRKRMRWRARAGPGGGEAWGLVPNNANGSIDIQVLPRLRNRYFALRHGESEANLAGIISSNYETGSTIHGLTPKGVTQAREAATFLLETIGRDNVQDLIVYSSNFTRARQTASECMGAVENILEYETALTRGTDKALPSSSSVIHIDNRLIERGFGELDTTKVTNYNYVWPLDLYDAHHTAFGVEAVNSVVARVKELILELEQRHDRKLILLTSHADTLQIMQCYMAGVDPRLFSQYRFRNAEVRPLVQQTGSLPPPAPLCKIAPASALIESSVLPQLPGSSRNNNIADEEASASPASTPPIAESLAQLSQLYVDGALNDAEFAKAKARVLNEGKS